MIPSQETLKSLLDYDPETGVLVWKVRPVEMFASERACKTWNAKFPGRRAGTLRTCKRFGYKNRWLKILGKPVIEHRAIWVMMTGEAPPHEIDHKNRDATDNRWENLRLATHSENHKNRSRNKTNRSGMSGVSWDKDSGKWRVVVCFDGKPRHFGRHASLEVAKVVAEKAYRSFSFDPEHGRHDTTY